MTKRLLAVVLSLCLLMSTMVGMTLTVSADNPEVLYVNGVDILTAEDNTVTCGSGTAVYNASDGTLTLTNAEITTSYLSYGGIYSNNGDLSVVLVGSNSVSDLRYGIYTGSGSLKISGAGNLTLDGITIMGIFATNGVSISESTITGTDSAYLISISYGTVDISSSTISASYAGDNFSLAIVGDIVVKNSTLNLEGFIQALTGGDITISENSIVTCTSDVSEACAICGDAVSISGSTVTAKCTADDSFPAIEVDMLTITGSTVNLESVGSNAVYTYETISITDSEVTASGYYPALYGETGVTLTNSVVNAESSADVAIYSPADIYIEDGTVTATGGDSCVGILAGGKIHISGSPTIISYGGVGATDGIVISITDETLEVKVGTSESDLIHYDNSPYSSEIIIDALEYGYLLIQPHSVAHTYSEPVWSWNGNTATATFTCSDCGGVQTVEATVTSSNILGVVTRTATVTFNGETYTSTQTTGTSLLTIGANYTAVNEAIAKANALNPSDYTNFADVTAAISAVDWTLNVLNQPTVDAYAEAIEAAIENLVPVDSEDVEITEPVEDTNTESEPDEEPEVISDETNPTTGAVVALLPMAMAIATVVASKQKR